MYYLRYFVSLYSDEFTKKFRDTLSSIIFFRLKRKRIFFYFCWAVFSFSHIWQLFGNLSKRPHTMEQCELLTREIVNGTSFAATNLTCNRCPRNFNHNFLFLLMFLKTHTSIYLKTFFNSWFLQILLIITI